MTTTMQHQQHQQYFSTPASASASGSGSGSGSASRSVSGMGAQSGAIGEGAFDTGFEYDLGLDLGSGSYPMGGPSYSKPDDTSYSQHYLPSLHQQHYSNQNDNQSQNPNNQFYTPESMPHQNAKMYPATNPQSEYTGMTPGQGRGHTGMGQIHTQSSAQVYQSQFDGANQLNLHSSIHPLPTYHPSHPQSQPHLHSQARIQPQPQHLQHLQQQQQYQSHLPHLTQSSHTMQLHYQQQQQQQQLQQQQQQRPQQTLSFLPPGYPAPAILTRVTPTLPRTTSGGWKTINSGGGMLAPPPPPPEGFGYEDGVIGGDYDDGDDDEDGERNGEVRHRRRTTPEQLKTLEYWFEVNPKPDNNTREWLAAKMGMTKRNVQVWFQNRRAKVKNVAAKEKAAAEKAEADAYAAMTSRTPEAQLITTIISPPIPKTTISASTSTSSASPDLLPPQHHPPVSAPPILLPPRPYPRSTSDVSHGSLRPPPPPLSGSHLLSPVGSVNMGRRVSLANGEVANMESFLAKHRASVASRSAIHGRGGFVSPIRSPVMLASAARRSSGPYPSPQLDALGSPKVRAMPSTLHLAAMRNNTRRSSMPGVPLLLPGPGAHLLASGPFTPPRMASGNYPSINGPPNMGMGVGGARRIRELSPIKDHDHDHDVDFPELSLNDPVPSGSEVNNSNYIFGSQPLDFTTTYLTPPNSTYVPTTSPSSYLPDTGSTTSGFNFGSAGANEAGSGEGVPFTPVGPGPNPGFSFGTSMGAAPPTGGGDDIWHGVPDRVRVGSLASIGTFTTDGTLGTDNYSGSDWGWGEMVAISGGGNGSIGMVGVDEVGDVGKGLEELEGLDGYDPDARRASAPPDLLHHLGILGINTSLTPVSGPTSAQPIRPSPLATHFTSDPEVPMVQTVDDYLGFDYHGGRYGIDLPDEPQEGGAFPGDERDDGKGGQGQGYERVNESNPNLHPPSIQRLNSNTSVHSNIDFSRPASRSISTGISPIESASASGMPHSGSRSNSTLPSPFDQEIGQSGVVVGSEHHLAEEAHQGKVEMDWDEMIKDHAM